MTYKKLIRNCFITNSCNWGVAKKWNIFYSCFQIILWFFNFFLRILYPYSLWKNLSETSLRRSHNADMHVLFNSVTALKHNLMVLYNLQALSLITSPCSSICFISVTGTFFSIYIPSKHFFFHIWNDRATISVTCIFYVLNPQIFDGIVWRRNNL